jgi:hypothetical protein
MSTTKPPLDRFLDLLYPPDSVRAELTEHGWEVKEAQRHPDPDFLHPEDMADLQRAMRDALASSQPLPSEIRRFLMVGFDFLCQGAAFPAFMPAGVSGRRGKKPRPVLRYVQEPAIRYLRWCKFKQLTDDDRYGTVANAYGVSTRTVRAWEKAWSGCPLPGLVEDYGEAQVKSFMQAAGISYQRLPK